MSHFTAFRALKAVLLVLLMATSGLASVASVAATYEQTSDNENNARTGEPDDDIHTYMDANSPNAPIEFNIVMNGELPRYRAVLIVHGYDIDPSDVTELSFNGTSLGTLTASPDGDWNQTTVELPLSLVKKGNNLVEVTYQTSNRVKIAGGELQIDVDVPDDQLIDAGASLITADEHTLLADGASSTTVTLTTFDKAGRQLTSGGATVALSTTLGSLSGVTDNGDGTYTATLTSSTTPGIAVITGIVDGSDVADTEEVQFVDPNGPILDALSSLIDAADDSLPANGTSSTLVTLTTYDSTGIAITTGGATVTLSTTLGTLSGVTDNGDGTYTARLTSAVIEGTAVITGVVNGIDVVDTAEVEFVAASGPVLDATVSVIEAADDNLPADGTATTVVTLTTFDTEGEQLYHGGAVVTLSTTLGSLGDVTDNGDGTYSATLTASVTEGTAVITGTVNGEDVIDTAEVDFIASIGPVDPNDPNNPNNPNNPQNPTDPADEDGNLETALRGGGSGGVILLTLLSALAAVRRLRLGKPLAATLGAVSVALAALPVTAADYQLCSEKADFGIQLPSCWYIGGGLGVSRLDPDDDFSAWYVEDKTGFALKGNVGYHILPHVFLEASYADLGDAVVSSRNPAISGDEDVHYKTPGAWLGYLVFDPASRWNLYLKAGTAKLDTDAPSVVGHDQEHNWQFALSGGVQYRFSRRWFARLEIDSYDKDARAGFLTINRYFGVDKKRPEPPAPAEPAPAPVAIAAPEPAPLPPPCRKFTGVLEGVHFATAKADLNAKARKSLDVVVGSLQEFPAMEVEISAHTDSRGTDEYNMRLSQRRADSVVGYLQQGGIARQRMQAKSYGESRPIADNSTAEGMAKNRRVEIKPTNVEGCAP